MKYDSTKDTIEHIEAVKNNIHDFMVDLAERSIRHDASKLEEPEKTIYDTIKPKIAEIEKEFGYGSPEYLDMAKEFEPAFRHHFQANSHHPEHFENGINGMSLVDVVEMFCDWKAAAGRYGKPVDLESNRKRFGISDQLYDILKNTLKD